MNPSGWRGYAEEHTGRLLWAMVVVWTLLVGGSWWWNLHQTREFALELARREAELSLNKDLAHRLWAARYGGVYVPVTPQTPPNPYLAQIPERDIRTPSGQTLTLLNPAYMTRQVHELATTLYGIRGHLTSLKPLRPENAPDNWEAQALVTFESGSPEIVEVVFLDGQPQIRLMRPWRTEAACLKCHGEQGYKLGDIQGGISVAVPLQPYLDGIRSQTRHLAAGHGLLWLLGVAGIFGGGQRLQKHLEQRRQVEAELAETLRQKEEALAQLERLASFPQLNPNPILEIDPGGTITFANQASLEVVQQIGSETGLSDFLPRDWPAVQQSLREPGAKTYDCEVQIKDRVFSASIAYAESFDVWRIYARDITARKQAEAALQRAHEELEERVRQRTQELIRQTEKAAGIGRLYRVLSRVNETIVRAHDPAGLFEQTCRIAVEEGGFRLAWIGLADAESALVKPVAKFGWDQGYLENLKISVQDVSESRGPTGVAVREGRRDICNDYATDPRMAPWRQKALERGYLSSAAFPLRLGSRVVGAITLYADRAGFFTADEIGLLDSLSQDLSFALESMDRENARQAAEKEIHRLNSELEDRVRQRTAELSRVVSDLEQKNAELERFTYTISHDLKSPLVTINTFLGYLEKDMENDDADGIARDMMHLRTAASRMGKLLTELLEMFRVGRVVNEPVEVTFHELVEEAMGAVAGPLAKLGLEVQVSDAKITLYGDRPRLVEIWQNLLENAIKFMGAQPAPRLQVGMEEENGDTVFFVCDNGSGIDQQYHDKVFGIFEKLDAGTEGSGIGLALAKRIVEFYQGTIWVESAGSGQGACFRFTLPGAVRANAGKKSIEDSV